MRLHVIDSHDGELRLASASGKPMPNRQLSTIFAKTRHSAIDPITVMRTSVALDVSARGVTSVMPVR